MRTKSLCFVFPIHPHKGFYDDPSLPQSYSDESLLAAAPPALFTGHKRAVPFTRAQAKERKESYEKDQTTIGAESTKASLPSTVLAYAPARSPLQ